MPNTRLFQTSPKDPLLSVSLSCPAPIPNAPWFSFETLGHYKLLTYLLIYLIKGDQNQETRNKKRNKKHDRMAGLNLGDRSWEYFRQLELPSARTVFLVSSKPVHRTYGKIVRTGWLYFIVFEPTRIRVFRTYRISSNWPAEVLALTMSLLSSLNSSMTPDNIGHKPPRT